MKKHLSLICRLLLTLGWMTMIYLFSSQSGEESGGMSAMIAQPVTNVIAALRGGMTQEETDTLYWQVDGVIRTGAHFCEYALLGIWLTLLMRRIAWNASWLPWMLGTLFAVTDEWHQSFTPGRVSDPVDVLIDSLGVIFGVVLMNLIAKSRRNKRVHHS